MRHSAAGLLDFVTVHSTRQHIQFWLGNREDQIMRMSVAAITMLLLAMGVVQAEEAKRPAEEMHTAKTVPVPTIRQIERTRGNAMHDPMICTVQVELGTSYFLVDASGNVSIEKLPTDRAVTSCN